AMHNAVPKTVTGSRSPSPRIALQSFCSESGDDLSAVERPNRDEVRKQEDRVDAEAETEEDRRGVGERGSAERREREESRRRQPTECDLPHLLGLARGVGEERDPIPTAAQADDLPPDRPRCPRMAELVKERGAADDADRPHEKQSTVRPHPRPPLET